MNSNIPRELTRDEKVTIRKLVTSMCANYDSAYGCLPLDCDCVMLGKCWTGGGCKYFRSSVLPLDHALEAALTGVIMDMRACGICGKSFPVHNNQVYCSASCAGKARNKRQRGYMRKRQGSI